MKSRSGMLFSRSALARIIIPAAIQGIFTVTIGMVDSMMVSSKGDAVLAGVSLVSTLDVLLITLFSSLTAGGSVVLAQAMGRDKREHACKVAKQLLYATTAVAAAVTAIVLTFRVPLLHFLFGEAEDSVMQSALAYFFYLALSFPLFAIENSITAIFRAQGDSMVALKISVCMNLLNVAGNAVLIYGADMGAAGAAIATLFSRFVGAVVMLIIAHNKKRYIYIEKLFHFRPDLAIIKSILRIGVPNGIENSMFQFGRLMTSSLVSTLGTSVIAANSAALSLANLQYTAGGAIQSTMVAVVGRCVGAEEKEQAKHYAWSLLGVGYALIIGVVGLMCLFASPLLGLYGLSADASALARTLLLFHSAVSVVLWPTAFCLPSAFRAASDIRFTMVVSVFSMWVFRVALAYVMTPATISLFGLISFSGMGMGIMGIWIAMAIDWLFRAILFFGRIISGKWLTKYKQTA